MDKLQYIQLTALYTTAKIFWETIHFRNNDAETDDLVHWATFYGERLLEAISEILKEEKPDIVMAVGSLNSRGISTESTIPFTAE